MLHLCWGYWLFAATIHDTIYIKTQIFRLLRYYSPAPRNIARSDWATQNITHNMTSSIKQPYGLLHTNYASFTRKGILIMPYISLTTKGNSKEITHHYILYSNHLFIYFIQQKIMDVMMTRSQTFTDSHNRE